MFNSFYNLKGTPFQKSIKKEDLFKSSSLNEFFSRMEYMKQTRGIILLTGISGVGKTTALRAFAENLKPEFFKVLYFPLSTVSTTDFYHQLNRGLGGDKFRNKSDLFLSIQKLIIDYATVKKQIPVIIFDEIHLLKVDNLFELQLILNFNFDSLDPAIIILAGHSLIREKIIRPSLHSINQRFRLKYDFLPLSKEETFQYIHHQFKLVGKNNSVFNDNAIDAIYNLSSGTIRVINTIATKSLLAGTANNLDIIDEETVYSVYNEV